MELKLWLKWRFWFFKILKLSLASYFLKMMSSQKFKFFNILVLFRLVSHTCVHIGIVHLCQTQNLTWSLRNGQNYTWEFNISISASHCCLVLVRLKVLGLLACGFGKGFCCCWFSPSVLWDLQKGQLGSQPHFSSFWLVACSWSWVPTSEEA